MSGEFTFMIIAAIVIGIFFAGSVKGTFDMRQEAISRGYALYCPASGDFAWVGECEESKGESK